MHLRTRHLILASIVLVAAAAFAGVAAADSNVVEQDPTREVIVNVTVQEDTVRACISQDYVVTDRECYNPDDYINGDIAGVPVAIIIERDRVGVCEDSDAIITNPSCVFVPVGPDTGASVTVNDRKAEVCATEGNTVDERCLFIQDPIKNPPSEDDFDAGADTKGDSTEVCAREGYATGTDECITAPVGEGTPENPFPIEDCAGLNGTLVICAFQDSGEAVSDASGLAGGAVRDAGEEVGDDTVTVPPEVGLVGETVKNGGQEAGNKGSKRARQAGDEVEYVGKVIKDDVVLFGLSDEVGNAVISVGQTAGEQGSGAAGTAGGVIVEVGETAPDGGEYVVPGGFVGGVIVDAGNEAEDKGTGAGDTISGLGEDPE